MISNYPDFFDLAPTIRMYDSLAKFLGSSEDGYIEYHYKDAVALAGHSCPTVASAYLMTRVGLNVLYPDRIPERGGVSVAWSEDKDQGVTGVMANVVLLITGSADEGGFKGLNGDFTRNNKLTFGAPIRGNVKFTRLDNNNSVEVAVNVGLIPIPLEMRALMPKCMAGIATEDEQRTFGNAWQSRVKSLLLDHADDPNIITVFA
ncbi:hypothetical protein [Candidatus Nitrosacidococcus tergens]|uniref:Formylmethanofuran dehydrogenase subunit E domain-containing protein n=1 Tax=Candidatus Nitrosacidococcus tergens TaxID=553981 RepID=A0A7G1QA66_9GAMM|nr:hypothetical protein [Candidatus Nitrosacidococcus tergens]CAB1276478.1 conserved protein of unknown function [Candidatus Nitrosacidococcus tergens]